MMATMAAASAMSAAWLSPPKSTILKMVSATADDTAVMAARPTKLQTAAIAMAGPGLMAFVPTTVAIALGASVAPFTTVAPSVRTTMRASTGSPMSARRTPLIIAHAGFLHTRSLKTKHSEQ